jgi:biopolymer transport protein ExbD
MAALPMTQKGVDINLPPDTGSPPDPVVTDRQIVLEFTADRKIAVNHQAVSLLDLEARLRAIFDQRREKTLFIIGAGTLRYGDIMGVIDAARGAGVERVGIVTDAMRRSAGVS